MSSFCRDIVLLKAGESSQLLMNLDYIKKLSKIEKNLSLKETFDLLRVIEESLLLIDRNINKKVLMNSITINIMDRENV